MNVVLLQNGCVSESLLKFVRGLKSGTVVLLTYNAMPFYRKVLGTVITWSR